jgi:hypothetical protein
MSSEAATNRDNLLPLLQDQFFGHRRLAAEQNPSRCDSDLRMTT